MASEALRPLRVLLALTANPYFLAGLASLFAGLSVGQALGWARSRQARKRSRRSAFSVAFLSLALLAIAGIAVFPPKASLGDLALLLYALAVASLGALAGALPRTAGILIAAVAFASVPVLRTGLEGWAALRPGLVARLLPLPGGGTVGAASEGAIGTFIGELESTEQGGGTRRIAFAGESAVLVIEELELRGPLSVIASFASPAEAEGAGESSSRLFYRLAGAGGPASVELFPGPGGFLSRLVELPPSEGLSAGAEPARAAALLGFLVMRRATSSPAPLAGLAPVEFELKAGARLSWAVRLVDRLSPRP
jgi:hypothetical protein